MSLDSTNPETSDKKKDPININGLWRSYDLILLSFIALFLPILVFLPVPILRIPLGMVMVLLAPGYALTEAIFNHRDDMDGMARAALSFGLSVAILPVLALILNSLPWGIRLWPITISLSIWIVVCCGVAAFQRRRLSTTGDASSAPVIGNPITGWKRLNKRAKWFLGLGFLCICMVIGFSAYVLLSPNPADRLTEFYILGSEGLAENYPREILPGQEMQVTIGIVNREGAGGRYLIEARSGDNLLTSLGPLTLQDGVKFEQPLKYTLGQVGDDQIIDILLFYNGNQVPYRKLRLWVNVKEPPTGP